MARGTIDCVIKHSTLPQGFSNRLSQLHFYFMKENYDSGTSNFVFITVASTNWWFCNSIEMFGNNAISHISRLINDDAWKTIKRFRSDQWNFIHDINGPMVHFTYQVEFAMFPTKHSRHCNIVSSIYSTIEFNRHKC